MFSSERGRRRRESSSHALRKLFLDRSRNCRRGCWFTTNKNRYFPNSIRKLGATVTIYFPSLNLKSMPVSVPWTKIESKFKRQEVGTFFEIAIRNKSVSNLIRYSFALMDRLKSKSRYIFFLLWFSFGEEIIFFYQTLLNLCTFAALLLRLKISYRMEI